jgi:hypothetical protein
VGVGGFFLGGLELQVAVLLGVAEGGGRRVEVGVESVLG